MDCSTGESFTSEHFIQRPFTPTHVIVHRQMNDAILAQKAAAIERIKYDTTVSLKESYIPKETYTEAIERFEAEKKDKYVLKEDYESLQKELEGERLEKRKLTDELDEVSDRLEFALGQIEVLTKQLEREKFAFEKSFGLLKLKAIKETTKNVELESKCSEIKKLKEVKEDALVTKENNILKLETQLKLQEDVYQKQLDEVNVKLQQELYIAKTLQAKRKTKTGKVGNKMSQLGKT